MAGTERECAIFNRAVNFVLPSTIPTLLDRSDDYALGDVLVYEKRPWVLMPWRKHCLVFTGVNISELGAQESSGQPVPSTTDFASQQRRTGLETELSEKQNQESSTSSLASQITRNNHTSEIFSKAITRRTFGVDAKIDAAMQYAVAHFGVNISASEKSTVSVDFGKVERHSNNLPSLLKQKEFSVSAQNSSARHPVIKEALKNDRTFFVITSLYVSEKANINVSFTASNKGGDVDNTGCSLTTVSGHSTDQNPQSSATNVAKEGIVVGGDIETSFTWAGESGVSLTSFKHCSYSYVHVIRYSVSYS